jgi:hypothetical protein
MARSKVLIALMNGGLNLQAPSENGICVVLVASPVAPVAGYGVAFLVKSIAQVKTAFAQVGNEAVVTAFEKGFYAEAPEGTKVYILAMAAATTLQALFAAVNAEKALNEAGGAARLVAAIKFPGNTYVPTITTGFDVDVHNAVVDAQTLANSWFGKKKPFRFFIEGFAFSTAGAAKDYSGVIAVPNRNGHIVVGSIDGSTSQATLMALGRAAAMSPQQNIGRVKSGSLKIAESSVVNIGSVLVDKVPDVDLDTLYDKRYITFEKNAISSGYIFNDDNSLTALTDDYNNLRYGRIIDNATRIAYAAYYAELKEDVEVDEGGLLSSAVVKALENVIETSIDANMREQLSKKNDGTADVQCLVNPDFAANTAMYEANGITAPNFNILQTGMVYVFVKLRPKGCLKYINVFLGYTA